MAIQWGPISNHCRIGIEHTVSPASPSSGTTYVTVTTNFYFWTDSYVDEGTNDLSWSGFASGSASNPLSLSYFNGTTKFKTITTNVNINYGSAQNVSMSASLSGVNFAGGTLTASSTVSIPARPNPLGSATYGKANIYLTEVETVTLQNTTAGYTYTLWIAAPNGDTIETPVLRQGSGQFSWTLDPAKYGPYMPDTIVGTFSAIIGTYNASGTYIGSTSTNITMTMPSAIVPVAGTMTATENVTTVAQKVGAFVKSLSKVYLSTSGHAGVHGSTIKTIEIIYNGTVNTIYDDTQKYTTLTTDFLPNAGQQKFTKRVTDSRGRQASYDLTINVLDYNPPKIGVLSVPRADSAGNLVANGVYVKASSTGNIQSLVNGNEKNALTYKLDSRLRGSTTWTNKKTATLGTGVLSLNANDVLAGPYGTDQSYEFMLTLSDQFQSSSLIVTLGTEIVPLAIGKTGIGVGKTHERGSLDVKGDAYVSGNIVAESNINVTGVVNVGGIPMDTTGYGVTYGSNANGEYWKFASGLLICNINTTANLDIKAGYGDTSNMSGSAGAAGLWFTNTWTWTFPQAYVAAPNVTCGQFRYSTGASFGTVSSTSTTNASLRIIDHYNRQTVATCYIQATAIGRWK